MVDSWYFQTIVSLVGLFLVYVLASMLSVLVRRNKELMTPILFGLLYGNYLSIQYLISNQHKHVGG